ncbi:hypothetical protein [Brevibacillus sp. 179-C 9.1 HS]
MFVNRKSLVCEATRIGNENIDSKRYGILAVTAARVATVPPTLKLTTDFFGRQQSGILFGWILTAHQLGAAVAAYGGGVIYTMLNIYFIMFIIAGVFCLIASVMVMRIGRNALNVKISGHM